MGAAGEMPCRATPLWTKTMRSSNRGLSRNLAAGRALQKSLRRETQSCSASARAIGGRTDSERDSQQTYPQGSVLTGLSLGT